MDDLVLTSDDMYSYSLCVEECIDQLDSTLGVCVRNPLGGAVGRLYLDTIQIQHLIDHLQGVLEDHGRQ